MLIKGCNRDKLYQELLDAQVKIVSAIESVEGDMFTFVEGTNMDLVQSIIDAHDPTPIPQISQEERIAELEKMINLILMGEI